MLGKVFRRYPFVTDSDYRDGVFLKRKEIRIAAIGLAAPVLLVPLACLQPRCG